MKPSSPTATTGQEKQQTMPEDIATMAAIEMAHMKKLAEDQVTTAETVTKSAKRPSTPSKKGDGKKKLHLKEEDLLIRPLKEERNEHGKYTRRETN